MKQMLLFQFFDEGTEAREFDQSHAGIKWKNQEPKSTSKEIWQILLSFPRKNSPHFMVMIHTYECMNE